MMFHKFLKSKNINICTLLFYILFLIGCKKNTVINDKQIKPNNINVDMNKPFIPSFSYGGILTLEQRKYLESQESIDSNHYEIIDYYFDSLTQVDSTDLIVFYKYYLSIPNLEIVDHVCVYTISEEGKILNRYLIPYTDDCFIRNVQQNDFGTKINHGWIGDFNHNGKKELILYHYDGLEIYEFSDNDSRLISPIEIAEFKEILEIDNESSSFTVSQVDENWLIQKKIFSWNEEKGMYTLKLNSY